MHKIITYISVYRYKFLDSKFVGKSLSVVLPKLAVDALLVTPVNLTLFYVGKSFQSSEYMNGLKTVRLYSEKTWV